MTISERVKEDRSEVLRIATRHGARNVRVIGSVAREWRSTARMMRRSASTTWTVIRAIVLGRHFRQELRRSVQSLHNVNLQRVDRMTMAHSIEGRVPFLDVEMIELAQSIPPALKLKKAEDRQSMEKWVLRKASEALLPPQIVWRDKEQFDEGSGAVGLLAQAVDRWMSPSEATHYARRHREARLRSAEECLYHKILCEAYPDPAPVLGNVARWADRPGRAQGR